MKMKFDFTPVVEFLRGVNNFRPRFPRPREFGEIMRHNGLLKIFSLACAIAVYVLIHQNLLRTEVLTVPVRIDGLPEGITVYDQKHQEVNITVRGSSEQITRLREKRVAVRVVPPEDLNIDDPALTTTDTTQFSVVHRNCLVYEDDGSRYVGTVQVKRVNPENIDVDLDRIAKREFKVAEPECKGKPQNEDGKVIGWGLNWKPDTTVAVSGSARRISTLYEKTGGILKTDPPEVDIAGKTKDFSLRVRPVLPKEFDNDDLKVSPHEIETDFTIDRKKEESPPEETPVKDADVKDVIDSITDDSPEGD